MVEFGFKRGAVIACVLLALSACARSGADGANWPNYGLDPAETRFSPLEQINKDTIGKLALAWSMELPPEARALEGTPIAVDGVLYFTTTLTVTYAVDAATGKLLWSYDPEAGSRRPRVLRTMHGVSRGLAWYDGAVIIATTDGRLISLDGKTGKPNWSVDTIDEERDSRKAITGAPRVFDGKVIIGNSGADFGTRGYVTTYDARTGKKIWRFYTVPAGGGAKPENKGMEMAARTWSPTYAGRWGGGGTVWNAITYDSELHRIYIGVGNSSNYNPRQRDPGGGDDLFLASIVALDADTGKYIWHYQANPREAWDFKATNDMVLTTLRIDGKDRRVLMQANMNGFFYVLDRDTGKLISANKFEKATWADHIDLRTGRPVEKEGIRYENGPVTFWPSPLGAHPWQPMSYSPATGLVYIPTIKLAATYQSNEQKAKDADRMVLGKNHFEAPLGAVFTFARVDPDDGTGSLEAWDPVAKHVRWKIRQPTVWNGGTMTTASGLVFQGLGDGFLHAYDGATGKDLWSLYVANGIIGAPITYLVHGKQMVSVLAGFGTLSPEDPGWRYGKHAPRVLTFSLDGKASLPANLPKPDKSVHPAYEARTMPIDEAAAKRGLDLWVRNCMVCHTPGLGTANAPDLRESGAAQQFDTLQSILHDGMLSARGMPKFDELTNDQINDIMMAVRANSRDAQNLHGKQTSGFGGLVRF